MQTWVKFDDSLPKRLRRAGPDALGLFAAALGHLSEYLLGDVLVDADVAVVAATAGLSERKATAVLEAIEGIGHVQRTEEGWRLVQGDIGDWARTKAQVDEMRARKVKAGKASAAAAKKRAAERQQAVEHAVQQNVQHDAGQSAQQTRDVSLDYVERLTGSDDQEPVDNREANIDGARSARAALKAVGE